MGNNAVSLCFAGALLGAFNGLLAQKMLSWAVKKSDKIFYSVWAGGFLYRLAVLGISAILLWRYSRFNAVWFLGAMILVQFALQFWPVKTPIEETRAQERGCEKDLTGALPR